MRIILAAMMLAMATMASAQSPQVSAEKSAKAEAAERQQVLKVMRETVFPSFWTSFERSSGLSFIPATKRDLEVEIASKMWLELKQGVTVGEFAAMLRTPAEEFQEDQKILLEQTVEALSKASIETISAHLSK